MFYVHHTCCVQAVEPETAENATAQKVEQLNATQILIFIVSDAFACQGCESKAAEKATALKQ